MLVGAVAVSLSTALLSVRTSALTGTAVVGLAIFAAILTVVALPSVGASRAAKLTVVLGAYVMGVHGDLTSLGSTDVAMVLAWLVSTIVVLVFPRIERPRRGGASWGVTAASVPLAMCLFAAGALGGVHLGDGPGVGEPGTEGAEGGPDAGPNDPLRSSLSVDMTQRPRLSERELFTVSTDVATFWRTNVFDVWNSWEWSRSNLEVAAVSTGREVITPPREQPSGEVIEVRQDYELLADALALPASPIVRRVDIDSPTALIGGTDLASLREVGAGTRYSIDSEIVAADEEDLGAARNVELPGEIAARYLDPGPVGERTAALASEFTADASQPWAVGREIEDWLGRNTRYSLDAPTSPPGSDVVEHFLFESRLGWCEQIASSLVVLARLRGVPARLAIGYVPAERTRLGDRWLVRERDAHAWAELWIDGVGWVPIDPTADVGAARIDPAAAVLRTGGRRDPGGVGAGAVGPGATARRVRGGGSVAVPRPRPGVPRRPRSCRAPSGGWSASGDGMESNRVRPSRSRASGTPWRVGPDVPRSPRSARPSTSGGIASGRTPAPADQVDRVNALLDDVDELTPS